MVWFASYINKQNSNESPWQEFAADKALNAEENKIFKEGLKNLAKTLKPSQIINMPKDELGNINWYVLSIWDHGAKENTPLSILCSGIREGDEWKTIEVGDHSYFKAFINRREELCNSFNVEIDFWDAVLGWRESAEPIMITSNEFSDEVKKCCNSVLVVSEKKSVKMISSECATDKEWESLWAASKKMNNSEKDWQAILNQLVNIYHETLSKEKDCKTILEIPLPLFIKVGDTSATQFRGVSNFSVGLKEIPNKESLEKMQSSFYGNSILFQMMAATTFNERTLKATRCAAKAAKRAAIAAIMSRNMSHNLGSHALANSKFFKSVGILDRASSDKNEVFEVKEREISEARGRLQSFNQYCQGRLDFIARKLAEETEKSDPLFLSGDVLKGFMAQQVLMDTLLEDNGFKAKSIRMHLHKGECHDICEYKYNGDSEHGVLVPFRAFGTDNGEGEIHASVEDMLIGITGGVTGCHALYALFENLLRNAAKYNRVVFEHKEPTLELHIEVFNKNINNKDCIQLRLWDNLTNDTANEATSKVRSALNHDVVDEFGVIQKGSHGIQEMKECAEYLAGEELAFPDDCDLLEDDIAAEDFNFSYVQYLNKEKTLNNCGECFCLLKNPKIRAYRKEQNGHQSLIYEMLLPQPIFLGITDVKAGGFVKVLTTGERYPTIKTCDSLEAMGNASPYFGIIIAHDDTSETIEFTIKQVAKQHTNLPFRLMVVTKSNNSKRAWAEAVKNASAQYGCFYPADSKTLNIAKDVFHLNCKKNTPILPHRRVHVIHDESFFALRNESASIDSFSSQKDTSKEMWKEIVNNVYVKWIQVWKGEPPADDKRWKLMIGFHRDAEQIKLRWLDPLKKYQGFGSLLDVYIGSRTESSEEIQIINFKNGHLNILSQEDLPDPSEACLVFDNHGAIFSKKSALSYKTNAHFYQQFSGSEMTLYQMLESPPNSDFSFNFYILTLLESCLTNIILLDERVADSTIKNNTLSVTDLMIYQSAGIHPLFSFAIKEDIDEIISAGKTPKGKGDSDVSLKTWLDIIDKYFITPNLARYFRNDLTDSTKGVPEEAQLEIQKEGIRYRRNGGMDLFHEFVNGSPPISKLDQDNRPDVIVIHEGLTDTFSKKGLWKKNETYLRLYSLLPKVVRTSGRGQETREFANNLPFMELNVVSDACYGALNKVKLARAVLNL